MGSREFHEALPSTQLRAIELARDGAGEGTRVVARRQTAGRGRLDRSWSSPPGGLYVSVVLASPPDPVTLLPLGIGAFLARSLRERYRVPLGIKWPNDVLSVVPGGPPRKLAGILVDSVRSPTLGRAVVAGIGINVRTVPIAVSGAAAFRAASLEEFAASAPSLDEVEGIAVESALAARRALATEGGGGRVRALCQELLYGVGRSVTVDGVPSGRIDSLGVGGELVLDAGEETRSVRAGDVRVVEEA